MNELILADSWPPFDYHRLTFYAFLVARTHLFIDWNLKGSYQFCFVSKIENSARRWARDMRNYIDKGVNKHSD